MKLKIAYGVMMGKMRAPVLLLDVVGSGSDKRAKYGVISIFKPSSWYPSAQDFS